MAYRPIIYLQGVLTELPVGEAAITAIQGIASPQLEDVRIGTLVVDTDNGDLVLRLNNMLYRYAKKVQVQSYIGKWHFNDPKFSHWIGLSI